MEINLVVFDVIHLYSLKYNAFHETIQDIFLNNISKFSWQLSIFFQILLKNDCKIWSYKFAYLISNNCLYV